MKNLLKLLSIVFLATLIVLIIIGFIWNNHTVKIIAWISAATSLSFAFLEYYIYHKPSNHARKTGFNEYVKYCDHCKKKTIHHGIPADDENPEDGDLYECSICKEYNGFI